MRSRNSCIFCLSLLLALPFLSFGQSQMANGSIVVTATDPDGAVVAGVIVKLINTDMGFARSVLTNDDGRGVATLLPLGTYEVTAQKPGFSIVKISEKTLDRRLKSGARLKPDESERMARLMRIISLAVSTFESEDNARQWLQRPLGELGGQTPLQLAATEPGSREIERVLGRIEHGIFA